MPGRLLVIAAPAPDVDRMETDLAGGSLTPHGITPFVVAALADTARFASHPAIGADLLLALASPPETLLADTLDLRRISQQGNSPGERLVNIFGEGFGAGYSAVGVVGSDTPHLPVALVQEAFGRLAGDVDAVFGPGDDGDYYLIALCEPHPELFADIPWGTGAVLEAMLKAATAAGVKTALLPGWYSGGGAKGIDRLRIDLRRGTVFAQTTAALLEAWTAEELPAGRETI